MNYLSNVVVKKYVNVYSICMFITILIFNNYCFSQWGHVNGLYGGLVKVFKSADTTIFAGTFGGSIYKLNNNFKKWDKIDFDFPVKSNSQVISLDIIGSNIIAAFNDIGIYQSPDLGKTWSSINFDLPSTNINSCILKKDTIFVATKAPNNIYRKALGDISWQILEDGLENNIIAKLTILGNILFAGSWSGNLYISYNNGDSWNNVNKKFGSILIIATLGTKLFISRYSTSIPVIYSPDSAKTWYDGSGGLNLKDFYPNSFYSNGSKLFLSSDNGAYTFSDSVDAWKLLDNKFDNTRITSICTDSLHALVSTNEGLFYTTDYVTWRDLNSGMLSTSIYSIDSFQGYLVAGTDMGIFISKDGGMDWEINNEGIINRSMQFIASNTNYIFAGGYNRYLYRKSDINSKWDLISDLGENGNIFTLSADDTTVFYSAFNTNIFRSTNNGNNWDTLKQKIPSSLIVGGYSSIFNSIICNGSEIFIGALDAGVYRSTDYGNTWKSISGNLPGSNNITILCVSDGNLLAGTFNNGIYFSTNNGTTWRSIGPQNYHITTIAIYNNIILAGTIEDGIFLTENSGDTWTNIGLKRNQIMKIEVSGDNIIAATIANGISICPLGTFITGTKSNLQKKYLDFQLFQNYPNPFNPTTIIKYSVSKSQFVTLKVFDLLGRDITTLVNEYKSPGNYDVTFDASFLASGIYFYRLKSGSFSEMKKLIFIK